MRSVVALLALLAGACTTTDRVLDVTPARWRSLVALRGLDPADVPMPMDATPEMRLVARQTAGAGTDKEKLGRLQAALLDRRQFAFEYDRVATFTAEEAFSARRGNCVSLTNLMIAMSRSVGIPLQAGLLLQAATSEKEDDLLLLYSHMVAVHPYYPSSGIYDFYAERKLDPRELRLLDDMEVAAIAASNRGVAELRSGHLDAARTFLERAVRLGPNLPDAHSNLGIVLWRQGDIDGALASFRRGLELDPRRSGVLQNLAALYLELGKTSEARSALAAANLSQASPYFLVTKGNLELAVGDTKAALRSYKKARSADPRLVPALVGIARAQRALGRDRAARKALEKAARLAPTDQDVRSMLSTF